MIITKDQITLEPADIAQFSKAAQKALATPEFGIANTGPFGGRTYKEVAETAFNQALANALEIWRKTVTVDSAISKVAEALEVETNQGKRQQAEALLDQVKELLDVKEDKKEAAGLNPTAEPAVPKTK